MIKRLIALLVIVLLSSCSILKQSTKELSHSQLQESVTSSILLDTEKKSIIDTTCLSNTVISIKEITFYPDTLSRSNTPSKVVFSDSTQVTGSIKSVKETIINKTNKSTNHKKDSLKTAVRQDSTRITNKLHNNEKETIEKPVSDPKKWRYIFYILSLFVITSIMIYVLLKKKQIIKKILKVWRLFI